jgi:hypothetical protein
MMGALTCVEESVIEALNNTLNCEEFELQGGIPICTSCMDNFYPVNERDGFSITMSTCTPCGNSCELCDYEFRRSATNTDKSSNC